MIEITMEEETGFALKEVNLEVLAKVMGVYSVGTATQMEEGLNVVFRQEEDDNSSWAVLNVFELSTSYKEWVLRELNFELTSWYTNFKVAGGSVMGAYCVSYKPEGTFDDFEESITASSEIKAVRIMAEIMYERSLECITS